MTKTEFKFSWPDKSQVSKGAFDIVKKLRASGHEAFIAGGAVRDALLKRPIKDIDIATSAKPAQVRKLFPKTIPTGEKHGTITVRLNSLNYEVTTFRREGKYLDARHPSKVTFLKSAEEDAKRRDFTINAMFYDPDKKQVIDYVNGIADLSHQKIRFVGDAEKRIREDALRLLRAVRFSATLDFGLERGVQKTIKANAKLITKISAERIKQELDRIMLSERASIGIGLLDVTGLLVYILPEMKEAQGVTQPKNQHSEGDVYAHSLLALENVGEDYDLATRYAILFHDLGKVETRVIREKKITFYNHQNVGAEIAAKICKRLKFSSAETDKITWLVKNHMVPNDFALMRLARRRKWGLEPYFIELLQVYLADVRASLHPNGRYDRNPRGYREGLRIMKEIKEKPFLKKPLLTGYDVMKALRIESGPQVGKVLRVIEEKKLSNAIKTKNDALNYLKKNSKTLSA